MNRSHLRPEHLKEATQYLKSKIASTPKVGVVLGSGLSAFAEKVEVEAEWKFADIPHLPKPSVDGHPGRMLVGRLGRTPVVVMQGRLHAYEGLALNDVVFPIRLMAALGIKTLVVTNAAGSLKKTIRPGHFVVIQDHLNFTGENVLRGENWPMGPRFVDMTEPYNRKLSQVLAAFCRKAKAKVHKGVYVGVMGPTYETAAEIRFFAKAGGHCVGMSTVAEVIAARHAGLQVVGLSCITNLGTGLSPKKLSHEEVKEVAKKVETQFTQALANFVASLVEKK